MAYRSTQRREFLVKSGQASLGISLFPLAVRVLGNHRAYEADINLIAQLEKLIPTLLEEANVPGASIAVIEDAKLIWRRGFGVKDRTTQAPVDNDTVFEAASVSKTVFAYAALKLCERGIIGLDTPLSKYTPTLFLEGDARLNFITPRHALSHTTGFQDFRSGREPLKIHFTPGEKFMYSGEGYCYLQSVMSQLAGRENLKNCSKYEAGLEVCATDIDAYLKRNLLKPFGMSSSGYVWNDRFAKNTARPHDVTGKPLTKAKPTTTDAARYAAVGGLHTTPSDYAKFLIEVLDPKASDMFRLNKKSHEEMLRPQIKLAESEKIDDADAWGLGWAIQQRKTGKVILHSGGQAGFRSLTMASVRRKSGFIILTNSDNGGRVIFNPAFAEVMNRFLLD